MNKIFTIGFTKKNAKVFFELLIKNGVKKVIDIRLFNTSQLSAFAKYPDIEFFLINLCQIDYVHDTNFAPLESTLQNYKKKIINWEQYKKEFEETMLEREIATYIEENYSNADNICLLCSEPTPDYCHRSLVAKIFEKQTNAEIINL